MLIEHTFSRRYVMAALDAGPTQVSQLIDGITEAEADWRPDPDRFTIREIVAHLADMEPINHNRLRDIAGDLPIQPWPDVARLAIDHDYARLDPAAQSESFRAARKATTAFLGQLPTADWNLRNSRTDIDVMTLEGRVMMILLHDTYHTQQIVEWRHRYRHRTE